LDAKANGPPFLPRRRHQLSDHLEKGPDAFIVTLDFPFQIRQAGG